MLRWARGVARRLEDHGIAARAVAPGFGAGPRKGKGERAQRVLLQEDPGGAADAAETGTLLSLCLDGSGVEVALEIPAPTKAVPSRLREALCDDAWRTELLAAFEALPDAFVLRLGGEPGTATAADSRAWLSLFDRAVTLGRSLKVAWTLPRDVAMARSTQLDAELEDGIAALVPIYKLVLHPQAPTRRARPKGKPGRRRRRPLVVPAASQAPEALARPLFERGAHVRVLSGPFAGKVGVVKEVDPTEGRAQVMLGLLATRIDVKDLAANPGGGRPTLSSSHRKPLGLR